MTLATTARSAIATVITLFTKGSDLADAIRKYERECYGRETIMETRLGWVKGIVVRVTWDDTVIDHIAGCDGSWMYTLRLFDNERLCVSGGSQQTVGADGFLFTGKRYSDVDKTLPIHSAYK